MVACRIRTHIVTTRPIRTQIQCTKPLNHGSPDTQSLNVWYTDHFKRPHGRITLFLFLQSRRRHWRTVYPWASPLIIQRKHLASSENNLLKVPRLFLVPLCNRSVKKCPIRLCILTISNDINLLCISERTLFINLSPVPTIQVPVSVQCRHVPTDYGVMYSHRALTIEGTCCHITVDRQGSDSALRSAIIGWRSLAGRRTHALKFYAQRSLVTPRWLSSGRWVQFHH